MKQKTKFDFSAAYDEMFMDDAGRTENKLKKIYEIPLSEIDDFPDHFSLIEGLKKHQSNIPVAVCNKSVIDSKAVFQAIAYDNPLLFWVDFYSFGVLPSETVLEFIANYFFTEEETKRISAKLEKALTAIISKVSGQTDYEKELSIHDLLIRNIIYDTEARKNIDAYAVRSNTIIGPVFYKTAVCEGISKLVKLLMNMENIPCIFALGNTKETSLHSWNIVKIGGIPYHLDLTWDISKSFGNLIAHDYFNVSDNNIRKDHNPLGAYPKCPDMSANYFAKNGLCFDSAASAIPFLADALKRHAGCISLSFPNISPKRMQYETKILEDY